MSGRIDALMRQQVNLGFLAHAGDGEVGELIATLEEKAVGQASVMLEDAGPDAVALVSKSAALSAAISLQGCAKSGKVPIAWALASAGVYASLVSLHKARDLPPAALAAVAREVADIEDGRLVCFSAAPPSDLGEEATKHDLLAEISELKVRTASLEAERAGLCSELAAARAAASAEKAARGRAETRASGAEQRLAMLRRQAALAKDAAGGVEIARDVADDRRVEELERAVSALQHRLNEANASAEDAAGMLSRHVLYRDLVEDGTIFFDTPAHALEFALAAFGDHLAVSAKAVRDASEYAGSAEEVYRALRALALQWLPKALEGTPPYERDFRRETGFEVTPHESQGTRNSKALMAQRSAIVDGREVVATHHLKGASSGRGRALRIHFAYDEPTGRLDIVRCGGHLDTDGGKRRGF